jgi:hypothetical protein
MALQPFCWALAAFQSFNPVHSWLDSGQGNNPLKGRYLHTGWHKQNKRTHTSMPWVGFKPTIPAFDRAETINALDHKATVIGIYSGYS